MAVHGKPPIPAAGPSGGEAPDTIPALLRCQAARRPRGAAYAAFDPATGRLAYHDWAGTAAQVAARAAALAREGVTAGERIALWLPNGLDWVWFDQAALSLGLVVVPLFPDEARATIAALLADSGACLVVVAHPQAWQDLGRHAASLAAVRRVIAVGGAPGPEADPRLRALGPWLAEAGGSPVRPVAIGPDTLATLVYTSGTTGRPKGVLLSHRNLLSVAEAVLARNPGTERDVFLSYLPLAHIFERVVGCVLPLILGAPVVFARSVAQLPEDLRIARPTVLLVVPSVLDRLHRTVTERAARAAPTRHLLRAAIALGWDLYAARRDGRPLGLARRVAGAALRAVAAWPLRRAFGGRLRLAVSGGAPLPEDVARFCLALGLPLVEGYGLTEAGSAVTAFALGRTVPGSVGSPLPGMDIRFAESGEILVRSPGVMCGYWRQPALTAEALRGGWLHTGDLGELRDGCLVVTGRIKELIVLSNGEKVSPEIVEAAITRDPLFRQAMVVGDGQPRLSTLAVADPAELARLARGLGLDPAEAGVLDRPDIRRAALVRIARALGDHPRAVRVQAVRLLLEPWTVEDGLVTPTRKLRRTALRERFAGALAGLHEETALPERRRDLNASPAGPP
ncbi:long-chain fatty acid--CoA ligase [Methylobacterium currus]|uniref:AMP-dependent synthetase/ligase n=1 Tax=Methylobacterium currus TaxID=2051553 RepID=UPI001E361602|nr:AMP-dependent synthetase/ligase [Methylobacterium currus]UHC17064.1 long-chain fatty acid--CoA ligase [Methylobacterium currus]